LVIVHQDVKQIFVLDSVRGWDENLEVTLVSVIIEIWNLISPWLESVGLLIDTIFVNISLWEVWHKLLDLTLEHGAEQKTRAVM